MDIIGWIKALFSGPPARPVAPVQGSTRLAEKHKAAQAQAQVDQADYEKRRTAKRAQGERKHQPMRKRGKS
jgi:uncharacterized protein YciI